MSNWGNAPEGIAQIHGCKDCGTGTSPENLAVLLAAKKAVEGVDFSSSTDAPHANHSKGGGYSRG